MFIIKLAEMVKGFFYLQVKLFDKKQKIFINWQMMLRNETMKHKSLKQPETLPTKKWLKKI